MKKIFTLFAITLLLTGSVIFYFLVNRNNNVPEIPEFSLRNDSNISAEYMQAYHSFEYYRDKIKKNPNDVKNYVALAQIFIQESRVTGRHHELLPKAELLLKEALEIDPGNFDAQVTKASILMTLHQFAEAKKIIKPLVKDHPYSAAAYGVLVDAEVELGEYENAVISCDKMLSIRPDLRSYSRASYLRELYGRNDDAIKAMMLAANAGVTGQENRAWTLYQLGNLLLNKGKLDSAEFIFNGTLEERQNYAYALSGLSDVMAAKKNYTKAVELIVKATQVTPDHIFIEKLGDLYKAMGAKENESELNGKILDALKQHKEDGYDVDLEYAIYFSNHNIYLPEALEHAEREYNRRPNNIDALDAYAWALHKNGKSSEAVQYIERAMRLNTKRAILHYHAAEIYRAINNNQMALKYLKKAFEENPYINPLYADSARNMLNSLEGLVSVK